MRSVAYIVLAAVSLAQEPASVNEVRRTAQPDIFALAELARSTPPEFAAWTLLRLLDAGAIADRAWRLDISREALRLAASASHSYPKQMVAGIQPTASRAFMWADAYKLGMDGLTLSMRAIGHIRRLDPAIAREAFLQYNRPPSSTPTCKDALIENAGAWFLTGGSLNIPSTNVQSAAEIAPAIDGIFAHPRQPQELDVLAGAIAERLSTLPVSSRAFDMSAPQIEPKLQFLYQLLKNSQRPTAPLEQAWVTWLQTGMSTPACKDSNPDIRRHVWEHFNNSIANHLPQELLKTAPSSEEADIGRFPQSPDKARQDGLFYKLMFGDSGRALSPAEKDTAQWRDDLQAFIQTIHGRTRTSEESAEDFFYRQSQTWAAVLMAAGPGPIRDRAMQEFISLALGNAGHIDAIVWFAQIESMTNTHRSLHGQELSRLLQALDQSGHPVLQLFARVESAWPARPEPPN